MYRRILLLALVVAAAVTAAGPAEANADTPHYTDPSGDAWLVGRCIGGNCVGTPSEPAVDILSGDLGSDGANLRVSVEVADIDLPSSRQGLLFEWKEFDTLLALDLEVNGDDIYVAFCATTANAWVTGRLVAFRLGPDSSFVYTCTSRHPIVDAAIDTATNELAWTIPLSALDAAVATVCPECPTVAPGTRIKSTTASARWALLGVDDTIPLERDAASTAQPYIIGQD